MGYLGWKAMGRMRRGENIKQIPQPAGVTAESPGRRDQYGVIKAALIAASLLLGTSFRPLLFHISARFRPGCEGIADSLPRFLLAPLPKMLPVVGQLVEFRAASLNAARLRNGSLAPHIKAHIKAAGHAIKDQMREMSVRWCSS